MSEPFQSQPIRRLESCSLQTVRRVAAMLDLDPGQICEGDLIPRGWHFVLLAADARRSQLRADGFPGLGVPIPDLGLSRLVLGRRRVEFRNDIPIGATVQRISSIQSLTRKETASGPMAFVTVQHALCGRSDTTPDIVEHTTYVLLSEERSAGSGPAVEVEPARSSRRKTVTPDDTMLFQYSALGFNSHKIHIDRDYARNVEDYPDLVVNGGLTTLLMTEFLRNDLAQRIASIDVRHTAPLFCCRPITLAADRDDTGWQLRAFDDGGRIAVDLRAEVL